MNSHIHAQIATDAAIANAQALHADPVAVSNFSALDCLNEAATKALYKSLPLSFEYLGKTYRMDIDIQLARVAIFQSLEAEKSMLVIWIR